VIWLPAAVVARQHSKVTNSTGNWPLARRPIVMFVYTVTPEVVLNNLFRLNVNPVPMFHAPTAYSGIAPGTNRKIILSETRMGLGAFHSIAASLLQCGQGES
jgi:hypothetical protein